MGASKTAHYSIQLLKKAKIASALGHPARLTIIEVVRKNGKVRPKDLESILRLSKHAVHNHIQQLVQVGIVELEFIPNEYRLHLNHQYDFELDQIFVN
ncbi:MAG: helix-turn-helix domain-containing protein [Bacteroidota bacterium]